MIKTTRWAAGLLDNAGWAWVFGGLALVSMGGAAVMASTNHNWQIYDWGQLLAFVFATIAVVVAAQTMYKALYLIFKGVLVLATILFVVDVFEHGSRFPGMHQGWLWVLLAIFAAAMWTWVDIDHDPTLTLEGKRLFNESAADRLEAPTFCAMVVFGLGLIAVVHSWAVVFPFASVVVPLGVFWLALIGASTRERGGQSVTA